MGAAQTIAGSLPAVGSFVLTGGRTASLVYEHLARATIDWSGIEIFFSDERCVPPTDDDSNYKMVKTKLLDAAEPGEVFRIHGEDPPDVAADAYNDNLAAVADGFDLMMVGMGAEGHICALFPNSTALTSSRLSVAVDRPDGMKGITMTPRALLMAKKIYIVERGTEKADAVRRAMNGDEPASTVPVRVLAEHPDVTFLIDEPAASLL
ncbi:MAG: 6-phosphogluconolactonase [Actinomycetota bacterium]|nr:6-phosphogluconolactonase [Actinomycetota bacterium]